MTAKQTFDFWNNLANSREHKLINVSNTTYIRDGTITLKCKCDCEFTTSAKSYYTSKNGCPSCKKKRISETTIERRKTSNKNLNSGVKTHISTRRKNIKENKSCFSTGDHNKTPVFISSRKDLEIFLKQNPNAYNTFILQCLNNKPTETVSKKSDFINQKDNTLCNKMMQKHHIFPIYSGGPDCDWNIIKLSVEDHYKAHSLRYDVYHEEGDRLALSFWTNPVNNTDEAIQRRIKLSHAASKANGTGFNNIQNQRENGLKGGKVMSESKMEKFKEKRGEKVSQIVQSDSVWKNNETGEIFVVKANQISLIYDFRTVFLKHMPPNWVNFTLLTESKKSNFSSLLSRVLRKERKSLYGISFISSRSNTDVFDRADNSIVRQDVTKKDILL